MIREIFYSIIQFFSINSMWLIISVVAVFAVGWGLLEYWLYRNAKLYTVVNAVLLAVSIFFILSITLLFRVSEDYQSVSVIPLDFFFTTGNSRALFKSMGMNIVMFIPLPLFGCSLFRCRSNMKAGVIFIVSGIGFSILIEIMQYLFVLGQPDADDVIFNTLGLLIGYLLYRLHDRYIMKNKGKKT